MTLTLPEADIVIPTINRPHRFRAARETTGLTQAEFANSIGVAPRTIARWERDEAGTPPRSFLLLVQLATRVPIEWLMSGKYTPRDLNPEPTD